MLGVYTEILLQPEERLLGIGRNPLPLYFLRIPAQGAYRVDPRLQYFSVHTLDLAKLIGKVLSQRDPVIIFHLGTIELGQ